MQEMSTPVRATRIPGMVAAAIPFIALASAQQPPLDGFWQSEGYGFVFEIRGPVLKAFEVTATTCVPGFTARRRQPPAPGKEAVFATKEDGAFLVRAGGTNQRKLLHPEDSVASIAIRRIAALPPVCHQPAANTPLSNFEVFAQTFAEHYISFERRQTDWKRVVAEARQKVHPRITPGELFLLLEAMIEPLGDLHTFIAAPDIHRSTRPFWRSGSDRLFRGDGVEAFADGFRWKLFALTDQHLLHGTKRLCNQGLHSGHLGAGIAFLRIRSFGAFAKSNDRQALESCLDSIFADPIQSLVLDMRLAFGGSDELGLVIARRLTKRPYIAYTVRARSGDGWTDPQPIVVEPASRPGFHGPVVVLTGPVTISAAESFVQTLMARDPPVIRMGEATQGVFCDVLNRRLPNGWTFGLPNAVYLTADQRTFDVTGIPPRFPLPVFADADIAQGKDPALEAARQVLSTRH